MHPEKRMHLAECEFEVFLHVGPSTPLEEQLSTLNGKYTEQLKLCQYMDSLYKNYSIGFSDVNSYLSEYVARHLKSITVYYSWDKQDGLRKIKQKIERMKSGSTKYWHSEYKNMSKFVKW